MAESDRMDPRWKGDVDAAGYAREAIAEVDARPRPPVVALGSSVLRCSFCGDAARRVVDGNGGATICLGCARLAVECLAESDAADLGPEPPRRRAPDPTIARIEDDVRDLVQRVNRLEAR